MKDMRLRRVLHFACGFVLGVMVFGLLGTRIGMAVERHRGYMPHLGELEHVWVWGLVGALVGGLVLGLLAMRRLDRFWERFFG